MVEENTVWQCRFSPCFMRFFFESLVRFLQFPLIRPECDMNNDKPDARIHVITYTARNHDDGRGGGRPNGLHRRNECPRPNNKVAGRRRLIILGNGQSHCFAMRTMNCLK